MNEQRSGNIYGGGISPKRPEPPAVAGEPFSKMDIFVEEMMRRQRRQSIALFLVTALAILLVSGMVYFWMKHTRSGLVQTAEREFAADTARPAPAPFEEPLPLYLIDPLKKIRPTPLPDKPADLTVEWVKQAVYHLLEGERAAQDGRYEVALAELENARKIFPQMKGVTRMAGLIQLQQKNYTAAAQAFELSLQEEAPSFGVINNLGIAYLGLTNIAKAEACLLEAVKLDTNYALAYFNLAMIRQRQSDLPKAAEYLGIYTRMRPDDSTAAENYAMMLIHLGEWEKAAAVLDELGSSMPQSSVIQFRLAQALSHVPDKRTQALEILEHAVTLVDSRKALGWLARPEFDLLRNEARFKKLSEQLASKGKD